MSLTTRPRGVRRLGLFAAAAVLVLGACSSDDESSDDSSTTTTAAADESSTTTAGSGESAETKRFDEEIQQWLIDVGCYSGGVDGIVGPETDKAIVDFQTAEGLTPDGEVGPETEAALKSAAEAGTQVCGGSTSTTASGGSTSTTATPAGATCTATSLSAAVGETINQYVCSGGYAGVEYGTAADEQAVLKVEGNEWVNVTDEVCGAASAGVSPQVLELGCSAATGEGDSSTTTAG